MTLEHRLALLISVLLTTLATLLPSTVWGQASTQQQTLLPFAAAITGVPTETARAGTHYVPVYMQLPVGAGAINVNLSVTLSVRNTSPDSVIAIRNVNFYDTNGALLQPFLLSPIGIRPYGTVNFFVSVLDQRGGSGGNFIVEWEGAASASEPVVEAIMLGDVGGRAYSFISRGIETTRRSETR